MKFDPHGNKERYVAWKEEADRKGINGLNRAHSKILLSYLSDMEQGLNIGRGSKKGARSHIRLNSLRVRVAQLLKMLEERNVKNITKVSQKKVSQLFHDLREGKITRYDGKPYSSIRDHVKDFKSFWNWLMKTHTEKLEDITQYLDSTKEKTGFVYFTKEQLEKMLPYFSENEQVRLWFMFDTIIRSPTELMNIQVSDLHDDYSQLTIKDEISKTYGRTIKILLCSNSLRKYVRKNKLKSDDYLFTFSAPAFNRKLKLVGEKVFGNSTSKGEKKYSQMTMYDYRHSGACHWRLGAYKSKIDALMYRGGWNNLEMLNYYTKKLGMKDSIEKSDLLVEVDKHELEVKIEQLESKQKIMDNLHEKLDVEMKGMAKAFSLLKKA